MAAQLTVRLDAIAANHALLRQRAQGARVAPVVKANAYGLGFGPIVHGLAAEGAAEFFVARLEEGIALRAVLPRARIFVLDGLLPGTAPALAAHGLVPVLNSPAEIADWAAQAKTQGRNLDAVLHVDTGMSRCGLSMPEISALAEKGARALNGLDLVLVMSHLACADSPGVAQNRIQRERFRAALALLPPAPASLAASSGIALGKDYLFDMVRPGIALYGGNAASRQPGPYRMAVTLDAPVLQLRRAEAGDVVGYGATFTVERPTRLAIIALGYADGLIRASAATGHAAIGGLRLPFAGRISMDLLALDATGIPEHLVARGTRVEFLGDTISLEEAAGAAGTVNHEVLTSLSPRLKRLYVEGVA